MAKKKTAPKKAKKKHTPKKAKAKVKAPAAKAKKSAPAKAKAVAKGKAAAKATTKVEAKPIGKATPKVSGKVAAKPAAAKTKAVAKARPAPRRGAADSDPDFRANQEVEIVRPKGRSRVARAGAGSGDLQGISSVVEADSESEDELLEEGQSFEAGIIEGVERAGDGESEVVTHEVLEDDVPLEYDDQEKDRP
jgi:hypothetical protein